MKSLPLSSISVERQFQVRLLGTNPDVIKDYVRDMENGDIFPPLVVYNIGDRIVLVDGFHRYKAYVLHKSTEVQCEVLEGTELEALNYARFTANRKNGQRLARADVRAIIIDLVMDTKYENISDRGIAELANVHHVTVASVRKELGLVPEVTVGKDGKTRITEREKPKEYPVPQGITESEWGHTPKSVKRLLWLYSR